MTSEAVPAPAGIPGDTRPAPAATSGWRQLVELASQPRFVIGASVFRLVAGVAVLYQLLSVYAQRHYLFGPDGVYPYQLFLANVDANGSLSLYAWSSHPMVFELLYHASIAVAVLWLIGWRTRILTPVLWLACWSLRARNPLLWDGGDNLFQLALLYACFIELGGWASADHGRRQRAGTAGIMSPVVAMLHNAGLLACAIQISLVYGIAGLTKVQGETWQNGTALYYALRGGEFTWPGYSDWIFHNGPLLTFLAYSTVAFQISFPFLLFLGRRLRVLLLLTGLAFHLGIMSFMALVSFGAFMMAVDLMFVTDGEYAAVGRMLGRVRAAVARTAGRLRLRSRPPAAIGSEVVS